MVTKKNVLFVAVLLFLGAGVLTVPSVYAMQEDYQLVHFDNNDDLGADQPLDEEESMDETFDGQKDQINGSCLQSFKRLVMGCRCAGKTPVAITENDHQIAKMLGEMIFKALQDETVKPEEIQNLLADISVPVRKLIKKIDSICINGGYDYLNRTQWAEQLYSKSRELSQGTEQERALAQLYSSTADNMRHSRELSDVRRKALYIFFLTQKDKAFEELALDEQGSYSTVGLFLKLREAWGDPVGKWEKLGLACTSVDSSNEICCKAPMMLTLSYMSSLVLSTFSYVILAQGHIDPEVLVSISFGYSSLGCVMMLFAWSYLNYLNFESAKK